MKIDLFLKEKIDAIGQNPYLFIGAGLSKRYLHLDNWEKLLRHFATQVNHNEFQYDHYLSSISDKDYYYGKLPQIATLLEIDYNKAVFLNKDFHSFLFKNKSLIQASVSPFKIAISDYLKEVKLDIHGDEIDLLKKLAIRSISGIITTNYDLFLESIFKDYKVYTSQEELIFSDIFQIGEIYKIHGCVTHPESIVITSKDYDEFERKAKYLIAKILTIFLEYPVIFIGYSVQDKNIQNILKEIAQCLSQDKLDRLKERLFFIECVPGKNDISLFSKTFENGNIIEMTKIKTDDFVSIYKGILAHKSKYNPKILRKLRQDIYTLVTDHNPKGASIIATDFEHLNKIDENSNIVIGLGVSKTGYTSINALDIYKDVVLDNQYYDPKKIVTESLPELLKHNSGGLPAYKYLKNHTDPVFDRVKKYQEKNHSIDSFLNKNQIDTKKRYRATLTNKSINDILKKEGKDSAYKKLIYLEEAEINIDDLHHYLKETLKKNPEIVDGNPELKRLIRIYDWLRYK